MKRIGVLLITAALIAGLVGCPAGAQYSLTVSSTAGGSVTTPGEGTFTYGQGTAASLVATPDAGFRFVEWTGDVGTVANVHSRTTTIAMNGDYSITANFVAVYSLTISSTGGGSVTTPGEGTFTYDLGAVVSLVAAADEGYRFISWTGDVDTIADRNAAATTISISDDYSVTASFEVQPTGAFLDEIVITRDPSPSAAIQQLRDGGLDLFAYGLYDASLHAHVVADPGLTWLDGLGSYNELTFNPVGPVFAGTGKLNPFAVPEFREAMHWLVDREYIATEIMGGRAVPRYTCLSTGYADAQERYPDLIAEVEAEYGHNPVRAASVIKTEMEKLGAVLEGGRWMYGGAPVEIICLIRVEDERREIGDHFSGLLEDLGFTVTRHYGQQGELGPIWFLGDPALGKWHIYTGGWVGSMVSRDQGGSFGWFYTSLWPVSPLWEAYQNDPGFYEAAERLLNNDLTTMAERRGLFQICLRESMKDNVRMFLVTSKSFTPMRADVRIAADLSGGVSGGFLLWGPTATNASMVVDRGTSGSWVWALTAHLVDEGGNPVVGGTMRVAIPDVLKAPWNPVAGSDWIWDVFSIRATGDMGHWPDTRTGLRWPGRIERAEVTVVTGLPVSVTNTEWCNLTFSPEIQVPLDAWADWDAVNQEFLTVENRFGAEGATAKIKSVSYYPKEIFEIPLHDGSTLSVGDFILYTILQFDSAKPGSAIYDESAVAAYNNLMSHFKGVRFITDNPDYGLIVEYYSDQWRLDAELMVTTMFPYYSQSPGMWHTIALGIRAEGDGALAFSGHKSGTLGVPWMNFIDGPSLPILSSYLDSAKATNYIPYQPTMGLHVTEAEVAKRWSNLELWYADKGHFWVGSGPFYLESADTTQKVIHLKRFEDYPDPMDKWLFLLEPLP